jgi:hypothetical protein
LLFGLLVVVVGELDRDDLREHLGERACPRAEVGACFDGPVEVEPRLELGSEADGDGTH